MKYFTNTFCKSLCLLLLIVSSSFGQVKPNKIVLAADYWCPYNCLPGDDYEGFLVELAKNVFAIYDIEVEYVMMPWFQALDSVKNGHIDGIIGITKEEGEGLLFPTLPQIKSEASLFVRSNDDWIFDGIESMLNRRLSVILDYNIYGVVKEYFINNYPKNPNKFVIEDGSEAVADAIEDLIDERADIFIEDKEVVNYYLSQRNLEHQLKAIQGLKEPASPIYIAFSPKIKIADSVIKMFDEGVNSLIATGDIKELNLKYRLSN